MDVFVLALFVDYESDTLCECMQIGVALMTPSILANNILIKEVPLDGHLKYSEFSFVFRP